jgi:hypothetical protein
MDSDCFAKAIEKEIALVAIERQRAKEAKALEQKNIDAACRTALRVRADVVTPLLDGLRDAFAKGKLLPEWEGAADETADTFAATCRSCPTDGGDLTFRIKAEITVQEKGATLGYSALCECEEPAGASQSKISELVKEGGYSVSVKQLSVIDAHRWFYIELEKCALACVREIMQRMD